ncbi:RE1 [Symbiodinium sp. CCMP2592]|nr:RE1 [Symbiodinium sp. CCMP2592]
MASDGPADPWSAPDGDPWNTSAWTGGGAHSVRPGDVNEPNAEASVQEQTEAGPQSSGNQEPGGGADAPAVDSWRGSDWAQRRGDNSSDGSSGDATTTADRRGSDGSWRSWTTWQSWPQQWHGGWWGDQWGNDRGGWYRHQWGDGGPTSWPTSTPGTAPTSFATDPSSTTWNSGGPGTTSTPGTPPTATAPLPSSTRSGSLSTATERAAGELAVQSGMKGPSEKLLIPSFSGDCEGGNELGTSARSYLRQIAAWEKMTKLSAGQRALVLYQNLQGSAWVNAESLCVEDLASDSGVTYLKDWIRQHYLDVEVTQVGRSLSDLFRKLRRKPTQTFRDYTAEFNRLLARVTECGCTLPDVANAWLFVDRANLDETTEVSLLASVGNKYALRELQQAAIVLDRSIRKPWEKGTRGDAPGARRFNSVNLAADGAFDEDDEGEEDAMLEDQVGQDTGELYISYMTAKAKYRDAARSRGVIDSGSKGGGKKFDTQAVKKAAEAKILLAKSKSHCASCGKKGHWHRDPECPNYEANTAAANKAQTVHVTNEIYELTACGDSSDLYAILDSACSKTVVGTGWLERYLSSIKEKGFKCEFVYERECFKFGAANRIYESTYAAVIMMNVLGKWLGVKAAVIHGDLPLLMSRPALGHLGLVLDLGLGKAHFRKLGEGELTLLETSSGHPAICIDYGDPDKPDVSQLPKSWEPHGKHLHLTLSLRGMDSGAPPIAVWKMTKVQLLAEANRRGLAVNSKWTCPELRAVLTADSDYHRGPSEVPKGLSAMTIAELREEADKLKIPLGTKETKGSLMLKIRDTTAPDSTVMTIGRFRGSSYMDIPENYGAWASEEERKNGSNMSPDLKRFVTWRRHRRAQGSRASMPSRGYKDPEMDAMVPPPPLSETGSSVWGVVEDPSGSLTNWRPIPPSSSTRGMHDWRPEAPSNSVTPFTKAKATRRERSPEEKIRMEQEVDPETMKEIQALEAKLAEAFLSRRVLAKLGEDITGDGNELMRVFYDAEFPRINEVLAGEVADDQEIGEGEPDGVPGDAERDLEGGGERGAKAITFPSSVPGKIASSLRRLHQNLGHPSTIDFCRHLRLAGATREVLKAAKSLDCEVCRRAKAPAIAKPAKVAPCLRFNQMIGADIFYVHDSAGDRHQLLSLVDFSSSYHVVVKIARKDTATLEKAYCEHWLNVFGAPDVIAVDLENGLEKALARVGDWTGTRLRNAAGQAHYQAGYTERQGGIWKAIFAKLCDELSVSKPDIEVAIGAVSNAKNKLAKASGYSPAQHVFGYTANDPDDLLNGPHAGDPGDDPIIDDRHAREVSIRHSARAAYYHVQSDERVRRALAGRSRVTARPPECGERVFYYRKTKNNKRGVWMGPGTVIGYEGVNAWVTRGGRCILCSPEHIRLATPEELGQAFSLRAARDDLDRLLNLDEEEQAFEEEVEGGVGYIDPGDEEMEEPDLQMAEVEHGEPDPPLQGVRRGADLPGPVVLKRQRRKGRQSDAHGVLMMKRARTKRSREKALEKEIPWQLIPEEVRPRFRAAEGVQWAEHVDNQAIEVLSVAESERVRATVPADRILSSRFAYKDKHMGLRRVDPTADWKPKSRLVIAGHLDPDAGDSNIHTDSPTVARSSLLTVLQICATNGWTAAAGDVQAAFLQGVELKRELWISQPRHGIEGLDPRQIARVCKGIFGLSESPRMWFDRLFGVLTSEVLNYEGKEYRLEPSPLDACVLMMKEVGKDTEPIALLTIHVDDILIGAPTAVNRFLQKEISRLFPVDDWIEGAFEYTGSFINVDDEGITVNQASFVDGRLFTVEVPRNQDGKSPADEEQTIDNRSLLGALSWLSSQSRPDLACGVAMSQQLQRAPSTEDVRFVNRLTAKAKEHREHGVYLRKVDANDAVFIAYHDAGWANADLEEDESDFRLTPQEVSDGTIREFYDEDRPRRPKRPGSKVASQIGHLIMLFPYKVLHGEHARGSTLEWRSQSCKRVCRSTFGAETMAAAEGLEGAQYMRALFGTLLTGRLMGHAEARRRWPIVCLSDCKSLFDFLHKAGVPKVPTDRRLAIDLAALRQELRLEKWGDRLPFQWIPTTIQLADPLTKPKRVEGWWEALANGVQLPFKKDLFRRGEESFNQCKREDSAACRFGH